MQVKVYYPDQQKHTQYIYIYRYICCAFVFLDNKMYKMRATYIKTIKNAGNAFAMLQPKFC